MRNDFLQPGQNYSKMCGTELTSIEQISIQRNPRHNEHNPETQM